MRLNYFIYFHILSPITSVQKKGAVIVFYDVSTPESPATMPPANFVQKYLAFMNKMPFRRTGIHFCVKEIPGSLLSNNVLLETIFRNLQRFSRVRARVHYGSDMELQYKIRSHGVPMDNMPVDTNGNIRTDILNVWFHKYEAEKRNQNDSLLDPFSIIEGDGMEGPTDNAADVWDSFDQHDGWGDLRFSSEAPLSNSADFRSDSSQVGIVVMEPTPKDVLLGRGKGPSCHPGNVRFREIVTKYQEEYNNTPRYKRYDTPKEITRLLLEDGVRFLRKADGGNGWVECDVAEVEKKVKQVFRTQKKKMAKKSIS